MVVRVVRVVTVAMVVRVVAVVEHTQFVALFLVRFSIQECKPVPSHSFLSLLNHSCKLAVCGTLLFNAFVAIGLVCGDSLLS